MHTKILALFLSTFILCGCNFLAPKNSTSLYEQLGEMQGIDQLTQSMLINFSKDERIVERFRDVNITRFKTGFVHYICSISGGPCEYTGDSMQIVHAGHNYTNTEFNAVVDNLIKAMEQQKLPVTTQNQLLALLAPSYKDIVYQ